MSVPAGSLALALLSCNLSNGAYLQQAHTALVSIAFRNESAVAADRVYLKFWWGDGTTDLATDSGTFAPNATVKHKLAIDVRVGGIYKPFLMQPKASLESVHFTDGSTWNAPADQRVECSVSP